MDQNTPQHSPSLSVIDGGRDEQEKVIQRLIKEPHTFEQAEYERLMELLEKRMSFDERLDIMKRRIQLTQFDDQLEQRALMAILDGNDDEQKHLLDVIARRNALGLKVVNPSTTDPAAPDQSS